MLRKEELGSEAFRHYKHTVELFDDYLYSINLKEKSIDEPIIDGWIKEITTCWMGGAPYRTISQKISPDPMR